MSVLDTIKNCDMGTLTPTDALAFCCKKLTSSLENLKQAINRHEDYHRLNKEVPIIVNPDDRV